MMSSDEADAILGHLRAVEALRSKRQVDPAFQQRLQRVKRFQHARFERSYTDLLRDPGRRDAAGFFLNELYGPHDFTERDAQFARIVPALVRLFPAEIVGTVRLLAQLHALSERLDHAMAERLPDCAWGLTAYAAAWRDVGEIDARQQQITWMLQIGRALLRYTRNPLLRHSLRMMRTPARAAGLSTLQQFLEHGFDTFRALRDPDAFLALIASREQSIAAWLFSLETTEAPPWGLADVADDDG
jgi:hypothetical protein